MTGLLLAGALAIAGTPVWANDPSPSPPPACESADPAQAARDQQVVDDALKTFESGGFPALRALLPDLRKVISHAPRTFHRVETCDGRIVIHAETMAQYLAMAGAYPGRNTEWRTTPYPRAALLAGSVLVEYRDYPAAVRMLQTGVALAPDDAGLVGEAAGALNMSGRFPESLALLEQTLAAYPDMAAAGKARLLRAKGFAFGELRRFDEAEAAYTDSLEYEPGNPVAQNELRYIAGQRQGAPAAAAEPVNATTGEPNKH
jgi:tetratricopeptide (TPR) repeat protein